MIGTSTTRPSAIRNIGLPADGLSTTISPELERTLSALPLYLPAFESASSDDPAAGKGGRCISSRSRGSAKASLPITSGDSYSMISVESSLAYNLAVAIDSLRLFYYFLVRLKFLELFDAQRFRRTAALMRTQSCAKIGAGMHQKPLLQTRILGRR